jgi:hypothetical protein
MSSSSLRPAGAFLVRAWRPLLLVVGVSLLTQSSCSRPADPQSAEQKLLDKAVAAMWLSRSAADVTSLHTTSTIKQAGFTFDIETSVKTPDRVREVRRAFGMTLVHALAGIDAWASIDATVVDIEEAERENLATHLWLFNVSKISPLKDTRAFDLKHLGSVALEDGRSYERLRVEPKKDHVHLVLELDFDPATSLVHRFDLRNKTTDQHLSLTMDDYRTIDGVQTAHRITSMRNGKPHAVETLREVRFNEPMEDALFKRPVDLNRDTIALKNASVSGLVAYASHRGTREDLQAAIDQLAEWIAEHKLDAAGPLIVTQEELPATADTRPRQIFLVCIPVAPLPADVKLPEREGFGLRTLEPRRVLCMTSVGELGADEIAAQLSARAQADGLRVARSPLEIYFSADRKTRQIQLPVE